MKMKSYFKDIESEILKEMDKHTHVLVASGWLTSKSIIAKLKTMHAKVCIGKSSKMNYGGLDVHIVKSGEGNMMHHKFMVLGDSDGWRVLINGSYNFTENAKGNEENIMVIECEDTARQFADVFSGIFKAKAKRKKAKPKKGAENPWKGGGVVIPKNSSKTWLELGSKPRPTFPDRPLNPRHKICWVSDRYICWVSDRYWNDGSPTIHSYMAVDVSLELGCLGGASGVLTFSTSDWFDVFEILAMHGFGSWGVTIDRDGAFQANNSEIGYLQQYDKEFRLDIYPNEGKEDEVMLKVRRLMDFTWWKYEGCVLRMPRVPEDWWDSVFTISGTDEDIDAFLAKRGMKNDDPNPRPSRMTCPFDIGVTMADVFDDEESDTFYFRMEPVVKPSEISTYHYIYADKERFLDLIDEHYDWYQRMFK